MIPNSFRDGLAELLNALTASGQIEAPDDLLTFARRDGSATDQLGDVSHFFYQVWDLMHRAPGSVNATTLRAVAQRSASIEEVSHHVRTALDYLLLWAEVDRYFAEHQLRSANYSEVRASHEHIRAVHTILKSCNSGLSTRYGSVMLEAMLTSMVDRNSAAGLFSAAREENPQFASAQLLDEFTATYFSAEEVAANARQIAARRAEFMEHFVLLEEPLLGDKASTVLLFSCDPVFFAAFFPYWASTAEYLRTQDISLHFTLVGDYSETVTSVEHGLAVATAVSRLRGFDPAALSDALSFSTVEVPEWVGNPTTVYACARYLLARELAGHVGSRVFVLDIDMVMRDDPAESLRRLGEIPDGHLPVVMTKGLAMLVPARRHLAGRVFLPNGEMGDRSLQHVEDYIYAGLSRSASWTLDQNALTYASEQIVATNGPESITDIAHHIRSFAQDPVRQLYREGQRRQKQRISR